MSYNLLFFDGTEYRLEKVSTFQFKIENYVVYIQFKLSNGNELTILWDDVRSAQEIE